MILFGAVNRAVFDWPWSGIHIVSGILIGGSLARLIRPNQPQLFWTIGIGLLLVWEGIERTLQYLDGHVHNAIAPLKQAVGGFAFAPETWDNTSGDILIGALGLLIGLIFVSRINHKP